MDIYAKLKEILSELVSKDSIDIDSITPETELDELGLDSLDNAQLIISIEEMASIVTVKDVKDLIEKKRLTK